MNILFLGLSSIESFKQSGIYPDLLRTLVLKGHFVFCVTSTERRYKKKTQFIKEGSSELLIVRTLNIQKTNIIEKTIGTVLLPRQYKSAIYKHFKSINFDLIVYPTPPITLYSVVKHFKKKSNSATFLMLKDIFPQNAVDLGMLKKTGLKGFVYRFFRRKEKKLYDISDNIGCMSYANVKYVLKNNPELLGKKVFVFPNCVNVKNCFISKTNIIETRHKYNLPLNKMIFVYGGNLGKPQSVPFIIDCLKAERNNEKVFFLIVGDGTGYSLLERYLNTSKQSNFKLFKKVPHIVFDEILKACDVGLLFLDYKFTIPNFPSRLLSYMQARLPVLACTDEVSDVGKTIVDGGFGWWCKSNDVKLFMDMIDEIVASNLEGYRIKSFNYLKEYFDVCKVVEQSEVFE